MTFERYSVPARQVIVLAQAEARFFEHNYIGTEHILLGLISEGAGLGAQSLQSVGVTLESSRDRVERICGRGDDPGASQLPFTPRAKKVLDLCVSEAGARGDEQISSHHLLLALLREGEGVANRMLLEAGVDAFQLRNLVLSNIDGATEAIPDETAPPARFVILGLPGEGPGLGSPTTRNLAHAMCSFCGEQGADMFSKHTAPGNSAWICGDCLDLFHSAR
jgi:ATP-dependent Clp protease ATP-binding subunit ClpC